MAEISKITLPSGTTYDIKDTVARAAVAGGVSYIGVSTTAITDGGSEKPTINGSQQTPVNGNLVIYDSGEFIFTGTYGDGGTWSEFGDMSNLGDMAYVDKGYAKSFTPAGTVSQPTFTGTGVRLVTEDIAVPTSASFHGNTMTLDTEYTPAGSVNVNLNKATVSVSKASSGTSTYTPSGTVSQPTFTGESMTSTGTYTPTGTISATQMDSPSEGSPTFHANGQIRFRVSGTTTAGEFTPEGTVSAPTISVGTAGSTTTIKNPTSVTVAKTVVTQAPSDTSHPSNPLTYASVSNETLILNQIGYTTGASITTSNVTVKNGDASYTASAPTFTGTSVGAQFDGKYYKLNFAGTEDDIEVTGTTSGTVSQPTFSGDGARLVTDSQVAIGVNSATFTGTTATLSASGTPAGTVGLATTNKTATVSPASSGTATYTPSGTVSQPTFTGTAINNLEVDPTQHL